MRLLISFLLVALSITANARQITFEEARTAAAEFFGNVGRPSRTGSDLEAAAPQSVNAEMQPYYVFNVAGNNGFVIISGDNRAPKVLGYSDKGSFDFAGIPPQLSTLLTHYAKQLASMPETTASDPSWSSASRSMSEEKALETVNWGQGYPFNVQCPAFGEVQAPTGCVATAMAIVMKYNKWPDTYSWDAMPATDISESNCNEISRLMMDAGKSVYMEYGPDESGAHMNWVGHKLQQDFRYSPDCQYVTAKNFGEEEWHNMIRENIDNGHPVIYNGVDMAKYSNHAFVIDGYKGSDYHINWGWNGSCNGYYSLDGLILGDADYSNNAGAVINIYPDTKDSNYSKCFVDYGYFWAGGGMCPGCHVSSGDLGAGKPFDFSCHTLTFLPGFNGFCGVALVDKDNSIKEIIGYSSMNTWSDVDNDSVLMGNSLALNNIKIATEIQAGDKLQVVSKALGETDWQIVLGTLEAPSCIDIDNIKPNNSEINISINTPDVVVGYYDPAIGGWRNIDYPGGQITVLVGSKVDLNAGLSEEKESKGNIVLSVVGNSLYGDLKMSDPTYVSLAFTAYGNEYAVTADYIQMQEDKKITVSTAGTLESLIPKNEALAISGLTISGEINAVDIWYLRDNFTNLESLNLENVVIKSCEANDANYSDFSVTDVQPDDYLPPFAFVSLQHLKDIILPQSLKGLSNSCLSNTGLSSIDIPAGVDYIGLNVFYDCANLETVICRSAAPVAVNECIFTATKCPANGVLFVPVGAKSAYASSGVWSDFSQIIEDDNPDVSELNQEIDGIKYKIKGNIAVVVGYNAEKIPADVVIPQTITAFDNQYPVKEIGASAFEGSQIESVNMSDEVEVIGEMCFIGTSAKVIRLSDNIKELPFACLSSGFIEEVHLPENLEVIATAMSGMFGLKHLHIPAKVKRMYQSSSFGTDFASLESFTIDPLNEDMCVVDGVLFNKEMTMLLNYPGLKEGDYVVPDGVDEIYIDAFSNCSRLTGLSWAPTLAKIGRINQCGQLEHISLHDGVFLRWSTLSDLPALKSVAIGDVYFETKVFWNVPSLTDIYLTGKSPVQLEQMFDEFGCYNIYHSCVTPLISVSQVDKLYVPGGTKERFTSQKSDDVVEMWEYQIDRDLNLIRIHPLIDEIRIDNIVVDGIEMTVTDNSVYQLPTTSNFDLSVNYTLHGQQKMTTRYDAEFNAQLPSTDLKESGIGDVMTDGESEMLEVYNMLGIRIYSGHKSQMPKLPSGIYIIRHGCKTDKIVIE